MIMEAKPLTCDNQVLSHMTLTKHMENKCLPMSAVAMVIGASIRHSSLYCLNSQ